MSPSINRRHLLRLLSATPLAIAAQAHASRVSGQGLVQHARTAARMPLPGWTPGEERYVWPAGEYYRPLMAGTDYETGLFIFTSGLPGKSTLVLSGVHGNEPGGWLAGDWVVENRRPANGVLLVIPRANRVAIGLFERTTEWLADLNRSYPGFWDGRPMEFLAAEIVQVIDEFSVDLVHDMHESWSFYADRSTNGTAFLGQTIATRGDAGIALARAVVEGVNAQVWYEHELFYFRDPAATQNPNLPRQQNAPPPGRGTSSLGLNGYFPGLTTLLVEMGQQQSLERRIALHITALDEALRQMGQVS